jgi:hypothetical protein
MMLYEYEMREEKLIICLLSLSKKRKERNEKKNGYLSLVAFLFQQIGK